MRKRILIVDDDPSVRDSISRVLSAAGYEVNTAADAEEAAVRFVPERVDLVLLDLNLPSRSGWDVFEQLTTRHPATPIIVITGMADQVQTAVRAGVGALMEKPLDVPALLKTMDELLAEAPEERLRRMCGYQSDTKHFRPSTGVAIRKSHRAPARSGPRQTSAR